MENAIYVVENKNQELRTLINQYQHKQLHANINLLSMCLNGVIDAAVNGGIARYQEVRVSWSSLRFALSHFIIDHQMQMRFLQYFYLISDFLNIASNDWYLQTKLINFTTFIYMHESKLNEGIR